MSDPVRVFALCALLAGVAITCALPPSAAPDESRHLSRVYMMSEGYFAVPGTIARRTVPKSIPDLYRAIEGPDFRHPPKRTVGQIFSLFAQRLEPERRVGVANAGTHPPLVYLPHLVGVTIGRWLDLAPAALIWLGRIGSLAAWTALTALAIGLAPARRWTLVLLSLTPMAVASAASISADPITSAVALLFSVLVVRAICGAGAIASGERSALLGGALLLGLVKPGYAPLALAALAIPAARTGGVPRKLALVAGIVAAIAIPTLLWLFHAQAQAPTPATPNADFRAQLAGILANPAGFAAVLAETVRVFGVSFWTSGIGELGPLIVKLPLLVYVAFTALVVATIALDGPGAPLGALQRAWLVAGALLSILAVFVFAYLGWNDVGATVVAGIQGRYLTPALPLLVFALPATRAPLPDRFRQALVASVATTFAATLIAVFGTYYRA